MDSIAPLPTTVTITDDGERRHLARLLLSDETSEVLAAIAEREPSTLDRRLIAYGARLALDSWAQCPWTDELLTRLTGMPSAAWRSVLLGVDAGIPRSAWVLPRATDLPARRALTSMGHPDLSLIAAACLPERMPPPAGLDPAIATLVLRIAEARELVGEVSPPWSEDFGEPLYLPSGVREAMQRVREAMVAAEITPSDEPELHRVLAGELDDDDADWIVETLDDAAAQVADRYEPRLRGSLPPQVRDDWRQEWRDFAHVLVRAAHAGTS